jgi:hypothetical protein
MSDGWVTHRFGVTVEDAGDLVEVALRRNPKRAHLLVSTVLGKHVPTDPRVVHGTGLRLGREVARALTEPPALVIGYAETATGLGHCVAQALQCTCLHSTRREVDTVAVLAGFEETHSHATGHLLLPEDPTILRAEGAIVLVDDELSTGATALNTIAELHRLRPRRHYVIATLVDARSGADRERIEKAAAELGTCIDVIALGTASISWPREFPERAAHFVADHAAEPPAPAARADVVTVPTTWTARDGARHGYSVEHQQAAHSDAVAQAAKIRLGGPRVLVLGTEELMYAPLLIALELAQRPGIDVRFSSTTRSPVLALDEPGYPIRTRLCFPTPDGERFAYNVRGFDEVVVVSDGPAGELVDALRRSCDRVHVLQLPDYRPPLPGPLRGPAFGSYPADEVSWLLTDLSHVELEAPIEEREEAVQSGGAHYAESLPIEFQPSAQYQALFERALAASATRLAHAVGVVTELVVDQRGRDAVLVSLARAGTPVGILMRRWARYRHGLELPHYAMSIVRGRGVDPVALRYLSVHHDPSQVMFVDGWTGKGAIVRELAAGLVGTPFCADLAVLADTGGCVSLFGTRADFLIPSACLNSTVSGLVSRTVRNDAILLPAQFHGAKYYRDLAGMDVSGTFLDAISARFGDVADAVAHDWPLHRAADRSPTWAGWQEVERLSAEYGIGDVNLVKPGVGETTRVLLRRVPWRVLVHPDAGADIEHVRLLAEQRGVPVEEVPGLEYRCVGLIHPAYTRGATGADGRAVS